MKFKFTKEGVLKIADIVFIAIVILMVLNGLSRKEIVLDEGQKQALSKIFPESHINKITFWKGGLVSIGSTKTLCNSIYFKKNDEITSNLLIHETTHTWQSKTFSDCAKMTASSLYNQLAAFLKHGSRNYAYYYSLGSLENLNAEQEASIIEDYYLLKYQNASISDLNCLDCAEYPSDEVLEALELIANLILKRHN